MRTKRFRRMPTKEKSFSCPNDTRRGFISVGDVSLLAMVVLFTGSIIGGSGYLIHGLQRQANLARALVTKSPPAEETPEPSVSITVTPDMFHVTSIALGQPRLAIINGQPTTEGQSVNITTVDGTATLSVVSIGDGVVSLKYGSATISAKLSASVFPKKLH